MVVTSAAILLGLSSGSTELQRSLTQLRDLNILEEQFDNNFIGTAIEKELNSGNDDANALSEFVEDALQEYLESLGLDIEINKISLYTDEFVFRDTPDYYEYDESYSWFNQNLALLSNGESLITNELSMLGDRGDSLESKVGNLDKVLAFDALYHSPTFDSGYHFSGSASHTTNQRIIEDLGQKSAKYQSLRGRATLTNLKFVDDQTRQDYAESQRVLSEDPIGYENYQGSFDHLELRLSIDFMDHEQDIKESLKGTLSLPLMFEKQPAEFVKIPLKGLQSGDEVLSRYLDGGRTVQRLFPELKQIVRLLPSANYSDIERYLIGQIREKSTPINVFGLKINNNLISFWGVVLLLSVQLYFVLHYRVLVSMIKTTGDIQYPWIGLYHDRTSLVLFLLSLGFPVFVCVVMFFNNETQDYSLRVLFLVLSCLFWVWTAANYQNHYKIRSLNRSQNNA